MKLRRLLFAFALLVGLFLYAPIIVVMVQSFNASAIGIEWGGFTLDWYRKMVRDEACLAAARNTLLIAGASATLSTALGTALGLGLYRSRTRMRGWIDSLMTTTIFVPDIVMAVGLVLFFALVRGFTGWFELGLATMICSHITFQIPFVALVIQARLRGMDVSLEEAARDLGATEWQTFWHALFPNLLPAVAGGFLLAVTLSLDDFVISFFTAGAG